MMATFLQICGAAALSYLFLFALRALVKYFVWLDASAKEGAEAYNQCRNQMGVLKSIKDKYLRNDFIERQEYNRHLLGNSDSINHVLSRLRALEDGKKDVKN